MSATKRGFIPVEVTGDAEPSVASETAQALAAIGEATKTAEQSIAAQQAQATRMTLLAIQSLSQRALIAWSALFTAGALASAWVLWRSILPEPTPMQLTGLAGYAVFVLAIEFIRRR